ncbi:MAG: DNA gyrase inhibitor YacG [Vicinamibacteraceae bacterium]
MPHPTAPLPVCVYCRRHPVEAPYRPFCSKRCKLLDLAHWVDGDYAVAGEPMTDDVTIEDAEPGADEAPEPADRSGSSKRPAR